MSSLAVKCVVVVNLMLLGVVHGALRGENTLKNLADAAFPNENHIMTQVKASMGQFNQCASTDPPFVVNWTPKLIRLGETLTINFDLTPVVDLDKGTVDLTIWLPNYPDPIYQVSQDFSCADIHKMFPGMCPFKKGKEIKIKNYKFTVSPDLPLPSGTFTVQAKVMNDQGQELLCMKGDLQVTD